MRSTIREDVLRALAPDVADWNVKDVSYYFKNHGYLQESKLLEEQVCYCYRYCYCYCCVIVFLFCSFSLIYAIYINIVIIHCIEYCSKIFWRGGF